MVSLPLDPLLSWSRRAPWLVVLFVALAAVLHAAEVIPPAPKKYFNDYANVVSAGTAAALNKRLEDFEKQSSSQILVAIYPKMQSSSSIEDYTVRVAQSWKVGTEKKDNGAVLFVFIQDRKVYLQVGYGLEGAIPDATAKQIIETQLVPRFRERDFDGGLRAAVESILAAATGEYRGTGRTAAQGSANRSNPFVSLIGFIFIFFIFWMISRKQQSTVYSKNGRRNYRNRPFVHWGGGGFGGGGFGGGGGGFGGGGFSGGGGSFGGGGAGGRW